MSVVCRDPRQASRPRRRSRRVRPSADGDDRAALHERLVARHRRRRVSNRCASSRTKAARCASRASRRASRTARCSTTRAESTRLRPIRRASLRPPDQGRAARERIDRAAPPRPSRAGGTSACSAATTAKAWFSGISRTRTRSVSFSSRAPARARSRSWVNPCMRRRSRCAPGQSIGSNRFMLNVAATPYAALEEYADAVGTAQNARTRSIVNGWCSWFYTLAEVSEDEVLRNTAFAADTSGRSGSSTCRSTTATNARSATGKATSDSLTG